MRVSVFRTAHFNAAHRLHNAEWSDEKNKEVFGLCNNPLYHGHNYELEVRVTGEVDPKSGMVVDLGWLKDLIKKEVEQRYDHKNLNLEVKPYDTVNPTAENMCIEIWKILRANLDAHLDLGVRLYETPRNYVEYAGN